MLETARAVLILVALPGVNSGQVEATISGSDLVISGTRMLPSELRTAVIHRLELPQGRFERRVRLPAGQYNAIPKDGPSAGVAMFLALASLMTGRTVRSDTAMTGEISLRGLVLPVGGIKEKVVAAVRAGIDRVMLPARNRKDYDDIPDEVRQSTELIWLENVDDAVVAGLGSPAAGASGAIQRQTAANA